MSAGETVTALRAAIERYGRAVYADGVAEYEPRTVLAFDREREDEHRDASAHLTACVAAVDDALAASQVDADALRAQVRGLAVVRDDLGRRLNDLLGASIQYAHAVGFLDGHTLVLTPRNAAERAFCPALVRASEASPQSGDPLVIQDPQPRPGRARGGACAVTRRHLRLCREFATVALGIAAGLALGAGLARLVTR